MATKLTISRRALLGGLGALALGPPAKARTEILRKPIPKSGQRLPVIGMGSWLTFDVGEHEDLRAQRLEVLRTFFAAGGAVVDSSPMYGSSEAVIGYCLSRLAPSETKSLFAGTKVWTPMKWLGIGQMRHSRALWGRNFALMQIHNMVDWQSHLETLIEQKAAGQIRYIGITTSHGRRHGELEQVLQTQPFDFVQLTYNVLDRQAERRLLPLAAERGLAVIANRPFRRGALFRRFAHHPLPAWAAEIDCANWAQVFLKFIVSHPALTCAIPATSRVDHMRENMGALRGRLPDAALRRRMIATIESL